MTTPTTNLGISSIKSEFGGPSSNISITSFYRGGSYVSSSVGTSAVDGTPVPSSGQIRFGEFRGIAAASANSFTYTVPTSYSTTGNGSDTFTLLGDGTSQGTYVPSGGSTTNVAGPAWFSPAASNIGNSYYAQWTYTSGTGGTTGGSTGNGAWALIGSGFSVYNSVSGAAPGTQNATVTIKISPNASGTPVVGTLTINLANTVSSTVTASGQLTSAAGVSTGTQTSHSVTAQVSWQPSGTTNSYHNNGSGAVNTAGTNWYTPTTTDIGHSFYALTAIANETDDTGATSGNVPTSSNVSGQRTTWSLIEGTVGSGNGVTLGLTVSSTGNNERTRSANGTLKISANASGSPVLATWNWSLDVGISS